MRGCHSGSEGRLRSCLLVVGCRLGGGRGPVDAAATPVLLLLLLVGVDGGRGGRRPAHCVRGSPSRLVLVEPVTAAR